MLSSPQTYLRLVDDLDPGVGPIHRTPGSPPFGVVCASAWGRRVFVTVVCAWGRGGAVWCGVCVGVQDGYLGRIKGVQTTPLLKP